MQHESCTARVLHKYLLISRHRRKLAGLAFALLSTLSIKSSIRGITRAALCPIMAEIPSSEDFDRGATCKVDVLCATCQRVARDSSIIRRKCKDLEAKETYDHYNSVAELKASAENGCHLCTLFESAIAPFSGSRSQDADALALAVRVVVCFSDDIKKKVADDLLRAYSYYCWQLCILEVSLTNSDGASLFTQKIDVCRTKYWALDSHSHGPDDDECKLARTNNLQSTLSWTLRYERGHVGCQRTG